jgi:hypothetical protein
MLAGSGWCGRGVYLRARRRVRAHHESSDARCGTNSAGLRLTRTNHIKVNSSVLVRRLQHQSIVGRFDSDLKCIPRVLVSCAGHGVYSTLWACTMRSLSSPVRCTFHVAFHRVESVCTDARSGAHCSLFSLCSSVIRCAYSDLPRTAKLPPAK